MLGYPEIFLCPLSTKTRELDMKNRCKSAEEAKTRHFTVVILVFFEGNKTHLVAQEMNTTKL